MTRIHGLIYLCAAVGLLVCSVPARAQVWVDTTQLDGKLPDWVDPKYYHSTPSAPVPCPPRCVWVEPVYRTVCRKVWHEPVMETICERVWIDGHYEPREVVAYDSAGSRCVRHESMWVPGHYEDRQRQVVRLPGYWQEAMVRELITQGHWELVASRN